MGTTNFAFPFPPVWDSHDLADAVPLRLHELPPFDALADGLGVGCANAAPRARRAARGGYLHGTGLAPFRIS